MTCTPQPKEGNKCKTHPGDWEMTFIDTNQHEVRPLPEIYIRKMLQFSFCKKKVCAGKDNCTHPHSQKEFDLWTNERLIILAVEQPRDPPITFKSDMISKLQICEGISKRGICERKQCTNPHSEVELDKWRQILKDRPVPLSNIKSFCLNSISNT